MQPKIQLYRPGVPFLIKALDLAVHSGGKNVLTPLQHQYPDLTPLMLGLGFQGLKFQYGKLQGKEVVKIPWAVHYRDGIDLMPCTDMEFAFPIDITDPRNAVKAIHAVVRITKSYAMKGNSFTINSSWYSYRYYVSGSIQYCTCNRDTNMQERPHAYEKSQIQSFIVANGPETSGTVPENRDTVPCSSASMVCHRIIKQDIKKHANIKFCY